MPTPIQTPQQADEWLHRNVRDYDISAEHYPYSLPQQALRFGNFDQARRAVSESGSHWFCIDTLKWWRARLCPTVWIGERFFITSQPYPLDGPRIYRVHWIHPSPDTSRLSVESFEPKLPSRERAVLLAHEATRVLDMLAVVDPAGWKTWAEGIDGLGQDHDSSVVKEA